MRPACLLGLLILLRVVWFNIERVQVLFLLTCPLPDVKNVYLRK